MVYLVGLLGICAGSFVNALVWRIHEQAQATKSSKLKELSITYGRSMCPHCKHTLVWYDLIPIVSWLTLGGKCRYCKKPISIQYPLVELATAGLFVWSYLTWAQPLTWQTGTMLGLWLTTLIGLIALFIYDLRWMVLPNRIVYPLMAPAALYALLNISTQNSTSQAFIITLGSVTVLGGLFWLLFQISKGKWIGGGDVKLGFLLGLLAGSIVQAMLLLFIASALGTLVALPLLIAHKAKTTSRLPFGPFLIVGGFITVLYGQAIIDWYNRIILFGL